MNKRRIHNSEITKYTTEQTFKHSNIQTNKQINEYTHKLNKYDSLCSECTDN
jgi:thymidine kinase